MGVEFVSIHLIKQFLVTNENKAKEMGDSGKRCVHEIYNWEKEEDRLLKIYSKL